MIFERVSCLFTLSWLFTFCLTCRNGLTYTMQVGYWDLMWKIMIFLEFQLFVYFQLIVYFLPYLQKWTHLYIITLARESIGPLPSCFTILTWPDSERESHVNPQKWQAKKDPLNHLVLPTVVLRELTRNSSRALGLKRSPHCTLATGRTDADGPGKIQCS